MCFTVPLAFSGHIAILDHIDRYEWGRRYLWRRAALKFGWLLVRDMTDGLGGPFIGTDRIVKATPTDAIGDDWERGRESLSVLGAISDDLLIVGGILGEWPGRGRGASVPYCGLVSIAGYSRREEDMFSADASSLAEIER